MPWTFEQRVARATRALLEAGDIGDTQVEYLRRPLFYGQYALGVGLSLRIEHWGEWRWIKERLVADLVHVDHFLQSNQRTYQFNVFSHDPKIIRLVTSRRHTLTVNHVRVVDRSHWHLKLPRPRPKGKFYGQYGWRFEFKDPLWGTVAENVAELDKLSGDVKLVNHPRSFLYLSKLSDVLMFKLIASEQLLSLEDRHEL